MTTKVRRAEQSDLSSIVTLANRLALASGESDSPEGGFLVSGFSESDYARYLDTIDYFYVYTDNDKIIGFLLAHPSQSIDLNNRVDSVLKNVYIGDFILIKRIGVHPDHQRAGVGTKLYDFLLNNTPDSAFLAAVVLAPFNEASIRFHQRFDFRHLLDITSVRL